MKGAPRLAVEYTGYEDVGGHVEYLFAVRHASGASWEVRWRFSELLAADAGLRRSLRGLPPFPSRGIPGFALVVGQDALAQRRSSALQLYLRGALACEEAESAEGLCSLLGMRPPDAVASAVVGRWLAAGECAPGTASAELEVALGAPRRAGPVEEVQASAWLQVGEASVLGRAAPGQRLLVAGLPCGEVVVLQVSATNGAGASQALAVQLEVPDQRVRPVAPGARVRAVWAGDGARYDAVVKGLTADGSVLLNWLRPAPLSGETLTCVCESGGDDTTHRVVPRALVLPLEAEPEPEGDGGSPAAGGGELPAGGGVPPAGDNEPLAASSELPLRGDESPLGGSRGPAFCLGVRLSEELPVEELRWQTPAELRECLDAFMVATRLKPLFREPLLKQAELMVREGWRSRTVDVVDLL